MSFFSKNIIAAEDNGALRLPLAARTTLTSSGLPDGLVESFTHIRPLCYIGYSSFRNAWVKHDIYRLLSSRVHIVRKRNICSLPRDDFYSVPTTGCARRAFAVTLSSRVILFLPSKFNILFLLHFLQLRRKSKIKNGQKQNKKIIKIISFYPHKRAKLMYY